jgi:ribosomal protein L24E
MNTEETCNTRSESATCVVCGSSVEPGQGAVQINHRGNTVNLCGPQCLRTFAEDPDPYLARLAKTMRERALKTEMACS